MQWKNLFTSVQLPESASHRATLALPEGTIARLGQGTVEDVVFTPDGTALIVGTSIGLWWYELESQSPNALQETEQGGVYTLSISRNNRWIATGSGNNRLKMWDMHRGMHVAWEDCQNKFHARCASTFAPDGQRFAVFARDIDTVYLVHPATGMQSAAFGSSSPIRTRRRAVSPLVFSVDSQLLAVVSPRDIDASSDIVSVWHVESGERIAGFTKYPDFVYGLCFSPCGRYLAVGCFSGILRVWDIYTGKLEMARTDFGRYRILPNYLPDGQLIATGLYQAYNQKPIDVWAVEKSEKLAELDIHGHVKFARFFGGWDTLGRC